MALETATTQAAEPEATRVTQQDVLDALIDDAARYSVYAEKTNATPQDIVMAEESYKRMVSAWNDMVANLPFSYLSDKIAEKIALYRRETQELRVGVDRSGLLGDAVSLLSEASKAVEIAVGGEFAIQITGRLRYIQNDILKKQGEYDAA